MEEFKLFDTVEVCFKHKEIFTEHENVHYFNKQKIKGFMIFYRRRDTYNNDLGFVYIGTKNNENRIRLTDIFGICTSRMVLIEKYDWRMANGAV